MSDTKKNISEFNTTESQADNCKSQNSIRHTSSNNKIDNDNKNNIAILKFTKKERGRYKKLHKRAITITTSNNNNGIILQPQQQLQVLESSTTSCATAMTQNSNNNIRWSGISTVHEWIEYQQLYQAKRQLLDNNHTDNNSNVSTNIIPGIQILYQPSSSSTITTPIDATIHCNILLHLIDIITLKHINNSSSNNNDNNCKVQQQQQQQNDVIISTNHQSNDNKSDNKNRKRKRRSRKTNNNDNDNIPVATLDGLVTNIDNGRDDPVQKRKVDCDNDNDDDDNNDDDRPDQSHAIQQMESQLQQNGKSNNIIKNYISIHNCTAVSHIAIIELQMNTIEDMTDFIKGISTTTTTNITTNTNNQMQEETISITSNNNNNIHNHNNMYNISIVPTNWFHTNQSEPQSITNKLMYQNRYNNNNNKTKTTKESDMNDISDVKNSTTTTTLSSQSTIRNTYSRNNNYINDNISQINPIEYILQQLEPYILSKQQLENNDYPNSIHNNCLIEMSVLLPQSTSRKNNVILELENAQTYILPYQHVINESNNNNKFLPFVSHHKNDDKTINIGNDETVRSTIENRMKQQCNHRRIFSIDCEMVETTMGKELARVTICEMISYTINIEQIIDIESTVHLDVIVQPRNHIINYLTKYSGISAATYHSTSKPSTSTMEHNNNDENDKKNIIVRLEQVQAILLQLIHPNDIVIGHSLENDLHALRWIHPTVIDTAIMFQPNSHRSKQSSSTVTAESLSSSPTSSFKYSLRHLAAVLLKKQIQKSDGPHCSQEDAITALELAIHRAVIGPSFRINSNKDSTYHFNWFTNLSLQHKMNHNTNPINAVCIGPIQWLQHHILSSSNAVHALQCESIDDSNQKAIVSWLTGPKRRASIVWSKIDIPLRNNVLAGNQCNNRSYLQRVVAWVKDIISKVLSRNTSTVLVIPLQTNYTKSKEIYQQRQLRRYNPRSTIPWSDDDEKTYQIALETCRNGYVIYVTSKNQTEE